MLLTECESFRDMANPPTTWKGAMEAVTSGAVDQGEIVDLVWECAEAADKVVAARKPGAQLQWRELADNILRGPMAKGQEPPDDIKGELIRMGSVADLGAEAAK